MGFQTIVDCSNKHLSNKGNNSGKDATYPGQSAAMRKCSLALLFAGFILLIAHGMI